MEIILDIKDLTELEIFFKEEGIIASNRELYLPTFEKISLNFYDVLKYIKNIKI